MVQALEEQYPEKHGYKIRYYDSFKFSSTDENTPQLLKIKVPQERNDCVIGLKPNPAVVSIL